MTEKKTSRIEYLLKIANSFKIPGECLSAIPVGSGNINDTYLIQDKTDKNQRYILQKINSNVFTNPELLMENISRISTHLKRKKWTNNLDPLLNKNGKSAIKDPEGQTWRLYHFISPGITIDVVESEEMAHESARAFAKFQKDLMDLPGHKLHTTISGFHHTDKVYNEFLAAVCNHRKLAYNCIKDIEFAKYRSNLSRLLTDPIEKKQIPKRICHNDTKINNVIFHPETYKAVCVIDLDTVMPGYVLHDFGDLVRTSVNPAPEDEKDLSKVMVRMDIFKATLAGYLTEAASFLTDKEIKLMVTSARVITFELGVRFLTDHLRGNIYFTVKYPDHNLVRARNQFQLLKSMEKLESEMEVCVQKQVKRQRDLS